MTYYTSSYIAYSIQFGKERPFGQINVGDGLAKFNNDFVLNSSENPYHAFYPNLLPVNECYKIKVYPKLTSWSE